MVGAPPFSLETSVTHLPGVGPKIANRLHRLEIKTIADLINHYPRRYEDWTAVRTIKSLRIHDHHIVIRAEIVSVTNERSPRRRMVITKALLRDATGELQAVWFNQPFLLQTLRVGQIFLFYGTVGFDQPTHLKQLVSPQFERRATIVPLYPETSGLSSKQLRYFIKSSLSQLSALPDPLPEAVRRSEDLLDRSVAIQTIHQPPDLESLRRGQERLAFDELLRFTLRFRLLKNDLAAAASPSLEIPDDDLRRFTAHLPFTLTAAQRRVTWEILSDVAQGQPMNRLLEGDVGSGKTVVAAFAAYVTTRAGSAVAWLAPTEILAEQHYRTVTKLLKPFNPSVQLVTRSHKIRHSDFAIGNSITIGTHALLNHDMIWHNLGLVIVDEQHRFGVAQRAALKEQADQRGRVPHFLSMTATPIPRTLALALYGDLDLSRLDEQPANRKPIITRVIPPEKRPAAYQFVRRTIAAGRQAYVVCPLIEEVNETGATLFADLERRSAIAEYEKLRTRVFPDLRIGLLHGRLGAKEKQATMAAFAAGALDLLVATAVIEVGIDVPNATIMVIEAADRFGLSALHQLRGRVGRGREQAYCFLMTETVVPKSLERVALLEQSHDGFAIASADLKLRGPGQFIGTAQSGLPDFHFASFMDFSLMERTRRLADRLLKEGLSPSLKQWLGPESDHHHLE